MSDRKHPYTPMKQTNYGYVSKEEQKIDKQLDKDLKKRLRREGAFNLENKQKLIHRHLKRHVFYSENKKEKENG